MAAYFTRCMCEMRAEKAVCAAAHAGNFAWRDCGEYAGWFVGGADRSLGKAHLAARGRCPDSERAGAAENSGHDSASAALQFAPEAIYLDSPGKSVTLGDDICPACYHKPRICSCRTALAPKPCATVWSERFRGRCAFDFAPEEETT